MTTPAMAKVAFNIADLGGNDVTKVEWLVEVNAENGRVEYASHGWTYYANTTHVFEANGELELPVKVGANPVDFEYKLTPKVTVRNGTRGGDWREPYYFPAPSTAVTVNVTELAATSTVPASWLTAATQQLTNAGQSALSSTVAARDAAQAARVAAEAAAQAVEELVITDLGTTDGQTKALIESGSSQTRTALDAAIGGVATGLNFRLDPAGDTLVGALDGQATVQKVVIYTDSTGTNPYRWPYVTATGIADLWPDTYLGFREWKHDTTEDGYNPREVLNSVPGYIEGSPGGVATRLSDNFNRTAADVIGTSPQAGPAWVAGASNAVGNWGLDGSALVRQTSAAVGAVLADLGAIGDTVLTLAGVTMSTLPDTANREFNTSIRATASSSLRLRLQVASGTGAVSYHLFKTISDASTLLATGTANPIPANTASTTFDISVTTVGRVVTCVVNGVTLTHTLSEADDADLTGSHVGLSCSGGTLVGTSINAITATVDAPPIPDTGHGLLIYNACKPGGTLDYHRTHLATMTPTDTTVALVNMGHNYGSSTVAAFLADLEDFVDLVKARAPKVRFVFTTQNPQFSPRTASQIRAHAEKMHALRVWCHEHGYGLIPGQEAFTVRPDRGASLMLPGDGVHPDSAAQKPDNGNRAWANAALAYLKAHSLTPR